MVPAPVRLKVLLPFGVFADRTGVSRIVAETHDGSFGLLPRRRDCVAALSAGILTYEIAGEEPVFLAVDEGVLIKTGAEVLVSVRRALSGTDLAQLRHVVDQEFLAANARDHSARMAMTKLETGFLRRLAVLQHE